MRLPASALLLASALCAQNSVVVPSTHANIPDGSTNITWFPFSSGISRQQIVYEGWDLGLAPNTPITRIGFRQDAANGSLPARMLQLEVRMGTTIATAGSLGSNFDANFAGSPTIVHPQSLYSLPALTAANLAIVWVNLTTPYVYPGGNLLVEFRVAANNNGNQSFPYTLDQGTFVSAVAHGVQGCQHSGGPRPVLTSSAARVGANWNLALQQAPTSAAIALFVNIGQPMTAPYSLQAFGLAPACQGQLSLPGSMSVVEVTNNVGDKYWSLPVPGGPAFNHMVVSCQVAALDFFVPGGVVVSNAAQVQFGIDPPSSILYSQGSATAATGIVYANQGVVTLFN